MITQPDALFYVAQSQQSKF